MGMTWILHTVRSQPPPNYWIQEDTQVHSNKCQFRGSACPLSKLRARFHPSFLYFHKVEKAQTWFCCSPVTNPARNHPRTMFLLPLLNARVLPTLWLQQATGEIQFSHPLCSREPKDSHQPVSLKQLSVVVEAISVWPLGRDPGSVCRLPRVEAGPPRVGGTAGSFRR